MKSQFSSKKRNALRFKIASALGEKIQMLPTELQEILLDDLVTAFENRLNVLKRVQSAVKLELAESVECEMFQA